MAYRIYIYKGKEMSNMLVKDFMTRKVATVSEEERLADVIKKFVRYGVSGMPVVKHGNVTGIITEKDVIRAFDPYNRIHSDRHNLFSLVLAIAKCKNEFESVRKAFRNLSELKVKDVMKKTVVIIDANEDLMKAVRLMNKKNINRLPVVKNGKLVGIIARADIVRALSE